MLNFLPCLIIVRHKLGYVLLQVVYDVILLPYRFFSRFELDLSVSGFTAQFFLVFNKNAEWSVLVRRCFNLRILQKIKLGRNIYKSTKVLPDNIEVMLKFNLKS
jgi:hypothetical protein